MSSPRAKEIHHRVMVALGAATVLFALAGAWIAFGGGRGLPSWMYGRLGEGTAPDPPAVRRPRKSLVRFRDWSRQTLARARERDRLIYLHLCTRQARPCRLMEETTYADPSAARFLDERFLPVRVDADERPDLAARYLTRGWPAAALLLPTGEILAEAGFMTPAMLRRWGLAVEEGFRRRRAEVSEAAFRALSERVGADPAPSPASPRRTAARAKERVLRDWDAGSLGFGAASRSPRFDWIEGLSRLEGEAWAKDLAAAAARGALALEDPVWGGFYRQAAGPGWSRPEHEKRLEDQAAALAALDALEPEAADRALSFVSRTLADPAGGYRCAQLGEVRRADGRIVEGSYYFRLPERRRLALGRPSLDARVFTGESALMAAAVLRSTRAAARAARPHALKTLERLWKEAVEDGRARRRPGGGPAGLLLDQVRLGRALLAAGAATGRPALIGRAERLASWCEANLLDRASGAFLDRPRRGELPEGLDRTAVPAWNAEAWLFLRELSAAMPSGDRRRERWSSSAGRLRAWLLSRPERLDPVTALRLARGGGEVL